MRCNADVTDVIGWNTEACVYKPEDAQSMDTTYTRFVHLQNFHPKCYVSATGRGWSVDWVVCRYHRPRTRQTQHTTEERGSETCRTRQQRSVGGNEPQHVAPLRGSKVRQTRVYPRDHMQRLQALTTRVTAYRQHPREKAEHKSVTHEATWLEIHQATRKAKDRLTVSGLTPTIRFQLCQGL